MRIFVPDHVINPDFMSEPTFGSGIAMGFKLGATLKTVATPEAQKLLKTIARLDNRPVHDLGNEARMTSTLFVEMGRKDLKSK